MPIEKTNIPIVLCHAVQKVGKEIEARRLASLRRHIEIGGRYDLELGCGNGEFAAQLIDRTNRWVLGVDAIVEWQGFYPQMEQLLILEQTYSDFMMALEERLSWLRGAVERTFLIMPHPLRAASELAQEIETWRLVATPQGELHARTEQQEIVTILKKKLLSSCREIPFDPDALHISSPSFEACGHRRSFNLGWKLL